MPSSESTTKTLPQHKALPQRAPSTTPHKTESDMRQLNMGLSSYMALCAQCAARIWCCMSRTMAKGCLSIEYSGAKITPVAADDRALAARLGLAIYMALLRHLWRNRTGMMPVGGGGQSLPCGKQRRMRAYQREQEHLYVLYSQLFQASLRALEKVGG